MRGIHILLSWKLTVHGTLSMKKLPLQSFLKKWFKSILRLLVSFPGSNNDINTHQRHNHCLGKKGAFCIVRLLYPEKLTAEAVAPLAATSMTYTTEKHNQNLPAQKWASFVVRMNRTACDDSQNSVNICPVHSIGAWHEDTPFAQQQPFPRMEQRGQWAYTLGRIGAFQTAILRNIT